jgi:hypothetical protein
MRNISKLMLVATLLAIGAARSNAQNTVIKVVQDLNFKLTGYYQMSPTENSTTFFRHAGKVSVSNKDIINLLEREVNIIFSSGASLQLISRTPTDPAPRVVIHDHFEGTPFDTDVTEYFNAKVFVSVEETKINKNPLKTNGKSYDVIAFEMKLGQVQFLIQGFGALEVKTGKFQDDPVAIVHTGKVNATGSGTYQVNIITGVVPVALTGTVQISGTEVKAMAE